MVILATKEAADTWSQLEIVMCQWRRIEQSWNQEGPFIYLASRTAFPPLDIS